MSSYINVYQQYHYEPLGDEMLVVPRDDIDFSYPLVSVPFDHEGDREAAIGDAKAVIVGNQVRNRVGRDPTPVSYHIVELKTLETIV